MPHDASLGLALCIASAIGYSAVDACLRDLTITCADFRVWVIFLKETVAVVLIGPWLAWRVYHGQSARGGLLPARAALALVVAGCFTQVGANLPSLWAFSVLGLAVAMPVMSGVNVVATAVLGRIFLGERISLVTLFSIAVLLASLVLLSLGAPQANRSMAAQGGAAVATGPLWIGLAIGAAFLAGVVYAALAIVIRRNVTGEVSTTAIVFLITGMGVVSLGPWGMLTTGAGAVAAIPWYDLGLILCSGVLNLVSFLAYTRGLEKTPAAPANVIMASQVAMCAVVGVVLFGEPASVAMAGGVCMTVLGMILILASRHRAPEPETPETPI